MNEISSGNSCVQGARYPKENLLQKKFHHIVPRTERKDAWPSMKLTRGEVALHGAVVFAQAAGCPKPTQ
jgi:hypothetical protein